MGWYVSCNLQVELLLPHQRTLRVGREEEFNVSHVGLDKDLDCKQATLWVVLD